VNQPPGEYHPNQPQVPPQWAGYPQTGQPGARPPGYTLGPTPPPPRPHRKNHSKRNVILLAIAAILVIGIIAGAVNGSGKSAKPVAATTSSSAASSASATLDAAAKAADACSKRPPASGEIYVRTVASGGSPQAQRLGGGWAWDHTSNKCLTSAQMVIATAPLSSGDCTQVGYVADNPGYDPNAASAAALTHVAAHAGPACQTAPPPAPAQTTPAAARPAPAQTTPAAAPPPPPASAAPAACHPLTNGGNCYEPGEFCRSADHDASGVAGDGEAITCQDNNGWRWEPV
jgi:hypothetical protein